MAALLRRKHFWLPLLLICLLELAMRWGAWEPWVATNSYAGRSLILRNSLAQSQPHSVDYITLGDSRAFYGIDHQAIYDAAERQGRRHISMAMHGSYQLTFKTISAYARDHMPQLAGVLLVMPKSTYTRLGPGLNELAMTQPFHREVVESMRYVPPEIGKPNTWGSFSSLMLYRRDVVDFLARAGERKQVHQVSLGKWALTQTKKETQNLCGLPVSDNRADNRADSLAGKRRSGSRVCNQLNSMTASPGDTGAPLRALQRFCRETERAPIPWNQLTHATREKQRQRWRETLTELATGRQLLVVWLPDLQLFFDRMYDPAAVADLESLLRGLEHNGILRWLDLRNALNEHGVDECRAFHDAWHMNEVGQETLSNILKQRLPEQLYLNLSHH